MRSLYLSGPTKSVRRMKKPQIYGILPMGLPQVLNFEIQVRFGICLVFKRKIHFSPTGHRTLTFMQSV